MNCAIFFLQDFKVEDVILELKDGKDFNAIFILGEKSFRVHLGMVLFKGGSRILKWGVNFCR